MSDDDPDDSNDLSATLREPVASMRANRLVYAAELATWLSAIGSEHWPTHRVQRMLARRMPNGEPLGFQTAGERSRWATTWGTLFMYTPRLAALLLSHVAGGGACPVCGRGGPLDLDGDGDE